MNLLSVKTGLLVLNIFLPNTLKIVIFETFLLDCKVIDPVFKTLNINGMIVGHTPQLYYDNENISAEENKKKISSCNGKVWKIDNGVSQAFKQFGFKQKIQVLEILNDNIVNILSPK